MKRLSRSLKTALCAIGLTLAVQAQAYDTLDISSEPLGTGIGVTVKPNLWFVLDNSGSMDWTYTPDYIDDSICQRQMNDYSQGTFNCPVGHVPWTTNAVNRSYYHPSIRYRPGVKADGTSLGNANPTAAKAEPYRYPNATSTLSTCYGSGISGGNGVCNLTTKFPHRVFCKSDWSECKENTAADLGASNFPYPNNTYRYNYTTTVDGAPYYYLTSGTILWCSNTSLTSCQTRRSNTYKYPMFGNMPATNGAGATLTITIKNARKTSSVTGVSVDGTDPVPDVSLLGASISVTSSTDNNASRNAVAVALKNALNGVAGYTVTQTKSCSGTGTWCQPTLKITAPYLTNDSAAAIKNTDYNGAILAVTKSIGSGGLLNVDCGSCTFSGATSYIPAGSGVAFSRVDIVPATTQYAIDPSTGKKYASRTDCAGTDYCSYDEELQNFANWYSYYRARMLMMKSAISLGFEEVTDSEPGVGFRVGFSTINSTSTYELKINDFTPGSGGHKESFYSKLFSVYGSGSTPLRTALYRAGQVYAGAIFTGGDDPLQKSCQQNFTFLSSDGYWNDSWSGVGNVDGTGSETPEGITTPPPYVDALNTSNALADIARYYYVNDLRPSIQNDVPKASGDETGSAKMWQHMKTFTMGLGIDGDLLYSPDYLSGGSDDYQAILAGEKNWGVPAADKPSAIDDMWHAAVNGHGQYFSASVPDEVADGIQKTLAAAEQQTGSAAAAATSNLEPVAGDNFAYVASYTTNVWDGNLEAKTIDLSTGELSSASVWTARDQLDAQATTGARTLYTYKTGTPKFKEFTWANLTAAEQAYFNPVQISACNPIDNCPGATNQNLFDFIIGKADATTNSSYREREHALGDIVSSQPVYVKTPGFNYADSGYEDYKNTSRQGMVYVGANDGFLHAFNADTGQEVWAYAPSAVLPNLWKLGDPAYTHTYYVDGTLTAGDVNSGGWKTILVGGLNAGGNYFYAWDVTDPTTPNLLWEFTDADMGLTYGNPVITKLTTGTWVVLLTSGYNNASGKGYLYVLDAITGSLIDKIGTGSGSAANPSGLSKISNWVDDPANNTTRYVYGGDLNGNMWRFDLDTGSATSLANVGEPITTRPELAEVKYHRVVIFGTGLFLQGSDRENLASRAIYAIKDDGTTTFSSVRGSSDFVEQTFTSSGDTRVLSSNSVDWDNQFGWYIPLPDSGERVNVDPKIQLGTLVVPSNVPQEAAENTCTVGGYAWLNYIDFTSGSNVKNTQGETIRPSEKLTGALAVGVNIVRLPDGKVVAITTTADNQHPVTEVPVGTSATKARRISWRELTNN